MEGAWFDYRPAPERLVARARKLAEICNRYGIELPHAAVAFPLRHPAVRTVVAGMRSPGHVNRTCGWLRTPIPDDLFTDADTYVTCGDPP